MPRDRLDDPMPTCPDAPRTSDFNPDTTRVSLQDLSHDTANMASTIDAAARVGESLSRSLAGAASEGKVSLKELASAVISAVNAADGQTQTGGLCSDLSRLFSAATHGFSGTSAEGRSVISGGTY